MKRGLNSFVLHILAMIFMLLDHLWATVVPGNQWMTCVGRLAFPIFAFMIVEGYYHTHNLKRYVLRLLVFALISEIPFDLMYGSTVFYPFHQNVLWTFLLAIGCIVLIDKVRKRGTWWKTVLVAVPVTAIGALLGTLTMTDYFAFGILMVLVFYFFHGRKWYHFIGQLVCLYYINAELFAGLQYGVEIFGHAFEISHQGLAVLALIPIWLYNGEQGPHNKAIQFVYYAFYPVHMLILAGLYMLC